MPVPRNNLYPHSAFLRMRAHQHDALEVFSTCTALNVTPNQGAYQASGAIQVKEIETMG